MTSIRDLLVAECGRPSVAAGSHLAVGRHDQQLLSTVEPLRVEFCRRVVVTTSPERVVYALDGVVMNGPYPLQMLCRLGLVAHCQQCDQAQMVRLAVVRPGVAGGAGTAGLDRRLLPQAVMIWSLDRELDGARPEWGRHAALEAGGHATTVGASRGHSASRGRSAVLSAGRGGLISTNAVSEVPGTIHTRYGSASETAVSLNLTMPSRGN